MSDQVKAIKSLEIDGVKVYESKGDKLSLITKGKLEILYIQELDRFVLRLEDFRYILSPKLSTVGSVSEEEGCRSYTVPNVGGHYIFKLNSTGSSAIIKNLETILSNSSHFSYQQNHEHDLENQVHRRGGHHSADYRAHEDSLKAKKQPEALVKANKYIKVGGEMLKLKIMRAASYIGNIGHSKNSSFSFQGVNQQSVKTIDQLKDLEDSNNQTVNISRNQVTALVSVLNEHEKLLSNQSYHEIGVKMVPSAENKWPTFKKAAVESAQILMKNMDDAAGDIAKTIKTKRANARLPQDKDDRIFKKIDQNIKGEAPLPLHQFEPDQQGVDGDSKANNFPQIQNLSNKVRNYFA